MEKPAAFLLAAAALASLGGCAAPPSRGGASCEGESSLTACVPTFCADGRLRRDLATDAPLFVATGEVLEARAPRFSDDGTVCRDPETGAPLYEEVSAGVVVRVLVLQQR